MLLVLSLASAFRGEEKKRTSLTGTNMCRYALSGAQVQTFESQALQYRSVSPFTGDSSQPGDFMSNAAMWKKSIASLGPGSYAPSSHSATFIITSQGSKLGASDCRIYRDCRNAISPASSRHGFVGLLIATWQVASALAFISRSTSAYMLVVFSETWPNHARMVLISTPARNRCVAVVWRTVCGLTRFASKEGIRSDTFFT